MKKPKSVIACQGGGSQTAFTAGVLSTFFESGVHLDKQIVSLSGTSGGAICASLAAEGAANHPPRRVDGPQQDSPPARLAMGVRRAVGLQSARQVQSIRSVGIDRSGRFPWWAGRAPSPAPAVTSVWSAGVEFRPMELGPAILGGLLGESKCVDGSQGLRGRGSRRPARSTIRPACELLESRALLSRALPVPSVYVSMTAPSQYFLQQSGEALITLNRTSSNNDGPLSVEFSTSPLTTPVDVPGKPAAVEATAGEHYLPVHEIATFQPRQTTLTVSLPIVREAANPGIVLVGMTTKPLVPNGDTMTGEIAIVSGPDQLPLAINDARIVRLASGTSAVTMKFNQPMERASVENLKTYRISHAGRSVPLQSATLDAATDTVTLVTKSPLKPAWVYDVAIGTPLVKSRPGLPDPANGGVPTSQTGNPLTYPQPALPGRPGTTPAYLSTTQLSGYHALPTTFKVTRRSSGPPQLNLMIPPIDIHYSFGSMLSRMLIPI